MVFQTQDDAIPRLVTYELTGSYQFLPAYLSSRSFMPFSRGQLASNALQFSGGEPVDKTFTVLTGRLNQSDAFTVLAVRTEASVNTH